jgi:uncharacterized protein
MDYNTILRKHYAAIVGEILSLLAEKGEDGDSYHLIMFDTTADGVEMPEWLQTRYPERMQLLFEQNGFSDAQIENDIFSASFDFSGRKAQIKVPFDAILKLEDPNSGFSLAIPPKATTAA